MKAAVFIDDDDDDDHAFIDAAALFHSYWYFLYVGPVLMCHTAVNYVGEDVFLSDNPPDLLRQL